MKAVGSGGADRGQHRDGRLLQSLEMKRHGEITTFIRAAWAALLATLARKKYLILAIVFMAVSFFAFMTLLENADLSFAVPASAASSCSKPSWPDWC